MKNTACKITALFLSAVLCISLSAEFTSNAQEVSGPSQQMETAGQDSALLTDPGLADPRIENTETGQKVTWDCVLFGSYPQAEVVPSADSYAAIDKSMLRDGDIIEDKDLYDKLTAAEWDTNNETIVDGTKYRKMNRNDATGSLFDDEGFCVYDWYGASLTSDTYRYFRYEPIKWRVLKVDGKRAFLLSDIALDAQRYNVGDGYGVVTWETCTLRSWLNGYGIDSNENAIDYTEKNFIGSAFSPEERSAIEDTNVINDDNNFVGTEGGNDTIEKIFLLSESEIYGDSAASYGFLADNVPDEARRCMSSTYAKAMGTHFSEHKGECMRPLRSPGRYIGESAFVFANGWVYDYDEDSDVSFNFNRFGMRPALNLDLSSGYTYGGTVSIDREVSKTDDGNNGDGGDNGDNGTSGGSGSSGSNNPPSELGQSVKVSKITLSGISKQIAAGKKIKLTAKITPSNAANKGITWKSSNKKVATVNNAGVVTIKKKTGGKSATITATAKDGSGVKAIYKIKSMKGIVKKVTISGKKSVKVGKTLKLKAKVTATKEANKKLKWTTSNKKYATVNSSGKVKALKKGKGKKVKITAMATDGSGKKKSVTIQIK